MRIRWNTDRGVTLRWQRIELQSCGDVLIYASTFSANQLRRMHCALGFKTMKNERSQTAGGWLVHLYNM